MSLLKKIILLLLFCISLNLKAQKLLSPFEKGNGNQSTTYEELVDFYTNLALTNNTISLQTLGETDAGLPLHYAVFHPKGLVKPNPKTLVLMINNGIHPGEPDGIDATMLLMRDLAEGRVIITDDVMVVTILTYNVGGTINRNTHSRANQNGPESYGFRGNARNYDLNRDFIKSDSKNMRSFAKLFHDFDPDVFVDNHVSNGADYQYTMTYIATQHQKLGGKLGNYFFENMTPYLIQDLEKKGVPTTPYVTVQGKTPEFGFSQMLDLPRYSTGFTSLFNTLSYMTETHMLKSYDQRVQVTYDFMASLLSKSIQDADHIQKLRDEYNNELKTKDFYPIAWQLDSTKVSKIDFLGYEAIYKKSDVTGFDRLFYDRNKPFKKQISYYHHYKPVKEIKIPTYYIVPKAWWTVIDLLKVNQIEMKKIEKDTSFWVSQYKIKSVEHSKNPYEGHFYHENVVLETTRVQKTFLKGDYLISTHQKGIKYLMETLEPEAKDSFFRWNFFDTILQQKEYFSAYVFEEIAAAFLAEHPEINMAFKLKKEQDIDFAKNAQAQLNWIYKQSKHYEKEHLIYPIYKIEAE